MVTLKQCKTKQCQDTLLQLQWKEQVKEEDHVKMEGQDWREFKYNGDKNRQTVTTDRQEWRKFVLEAKVHNEL
jgi:hypothetical protein